MVRFARREPSAVLLVAQLGGVLLYPFMEGSDAGRALFSIFGIAILGLVLLAVRSSPAWTWFGVLLALPASVLLVIQAVTGSDDLLPYSSAIEAVLYFYAAGALIAYMLADHEITRDELLTLLGYLLSQPCRQYYTRPRYRAIRFFILGVRRAHRRPPREAANEASGPPGVQAAGAAAEILPYRSSPAVASSPGLAARWRFVWVRSLVSG